MDHVHVLRYHGGYSFLDVLEMTFKERDALLDKIKEQYKLEEKLSKV